MSGALSWWITPPLQFASSSVSNVTCEVTSSIGAVAGESHVAPRYNGSITSQCGVPSSREERSSWSCEAVHQEKGMRRAMLQWTIRVGKSQTRIVRGACNYHQIHERRTERLDAIAAGTLGPIHRKLRIAQQSRRTFLLIDP